jgi:hypothetical protein
MPGTEMFLAGVDGDIMSRSRRQRHEDAERGVVVGETLPGSLPGRLPSTEARVSDRENVCYIWSRQSGLMRGEAPSLRKVFSRVQICKGKGAIAKNYWRKGGMLDMESSCGCKCNGEGHPQIRDHSVKRL